MTVSEFGPLPLSLITTTRKFFTVLASVLIFGHHIIGRQWMGAVLVFTGKGSKFQINVYFSLFSFWTFYLRTAFQGWSWTGSIAKASQNQPFRLYVAMKLNVFNIAVKLELKDARTALATSRSSALLPFPYILCNVGRIAELFPPIWRKALLFRPKDSFHLVLTWQLLCEFVEYCLFWRWHLCGFCYRISRPAVFFHALFCEWSLVDRCWRLIYLITIDHSLNYLFVDFIATPPRKL